MPLISLLGLDIVFSKALKLVKSFWKIRNWYSTTGVIEEAVSGPDFWPWLRSAMLFYNVFGPLSTGILSEHALTFIVGANLIGRRLFRLQSSKGRNLTEEEIDAEILAFRRSEERNGLDRAMSRSFTKLTEIDFKADNKESIVQGVAYDAVEAAIGYAEASFFRDERARIVKDLTLQDSV